MLNNHTSTNGGELQVANLHKRYGAREVLCDVSIRVAKGEVVGLLGPNGAGKTTCFYAIAGIIRPDRGRVEIDGEDISTLPMHKRARRGLDVRAHRFAYIHCCRLYRFAFCRAILQLLNGKVLAQICRAYFAVRYQICRCAFG